MKVDTLTKFVRVVSLKRYIYFSFVQIFGSCVFGVESVGYLQTGLKMCSCIATFIVSRTARYVHRSVPLIASSVILIGTILGWLLWVPRNDQLFIAMAIGGGLSVNIDVPWSQIQGTKNHSHTLGHKLLLLEGRPPANIKTLTHIAYCIQFLGTFMLLSEDQTTSSANANSNVIVIEIRFCLSYDFFSFLQLCFQLFSKKTKRWRILSTQSVHF